MTEALQRDELIALLNRLDSEDDAEVLEAARQAQSQITAAGLSWDDLLVPQDSADQPPDQPPDAAVEDGDEADEAADEAAEDGDESDEPAPEAEEEEEEPPAGTGGGDDESLSLIGELLARKDISQELRDELEGYKADIAEGEFVAADRRYLRAVHKRLKK